MNAPLIQYGYPHHSVRLECYTENEPKADLINWYRENEKITTRPYSKYESLTSESDSVNTKHMLSILDLNEKDFANYSCVAINKYGQTRKLLELKPRCKLKI